MEKSSGGEDRLRLVVTSHTVCRGPDGKVKWEADTVPLEVPLGTFLVMGVEPKFQVDTAMVKTGREHF